MNPATVFERRPSDDEALVPVKTIILDGQHDDTDLKPTPSAGLSYFSKIVLGDHHSLGLTPTGQCYAWGENSSGQLGLGQLPLSPRPGTQHGPRRVDSPRRIDFEKLSRLTTLEGEDVMTPTAGSQRFVFDITAGGWHSGALVADVGTAS